MRLPATLRNTKADPAQADWFSVCCTSADKPSMPLRRSTGAITNHICAGVAINPGIVIALPTRPLKSLSATLIGNGCYFSRPSRQKGKVSHEQESSLAKSRTDFFGRQLSGPKNFWRSDYAIDSRRLALAHCSAQLLYDRSNVLKLPWHILIKKMQECAFKMGLHRWWRGVLMRYWLDILYQLIINWMFMRKCPI